MLIPANLHFPKVALVEQQISAPKVADVPAAIASEFQRQRVAERDREAIEWALLTIGNIPSPRARLMRLKNTVRSYPRDR
jgi:hypothetical protein